MDSPMKLFHYSTLLTFKETDVNNDDDESVPGISMKAHCPLRSRSLRLPTSFRLMSSAEDPHVIELKTIIKAQEHRMDYDSNSSAFCSDSDCGFCFQLTQGMVDRSWHCDFANWNFFLAKLKIFDNKNKLLLSKCIHVSRKEILDCGCDDPASPREGCEILYNDEEFQWHEGTYTEFYPSFCCTDLIKKITKTPITPPPPRESSKYFTIPKPKGELQIEAEFFIQVIHKEKKQVPVGDKSKEEDAVKSKRSKMVKKKKLTKKKTKTIEKRFKKLQVTPKWKDDGKTDIVLHLVCTGDKFRVHKNIITAESDVFKAMLDSGMTEAQSGQIPVNLESVTKEDFEDFLDGLYGGWTIKDMEKNCQNIDLQLTRLSLVEYYGCINLISHVVGSIIGNPGPCFTLKNILEMYSAGMEYGIWCLKTRSLQWIKESKTRFRHFRWPHGKDLNKVREFRKVIPDCPDKKILMGTILASIPQDSDSD